MLDVTTLSPSAPDGDDNNNNEEEELPTLQDIINYNFYHVTYDVTMTLCSPFV